MRTSCKTRLRGMRLGERESQRAHGSRRGQKVSSSSAKSTFSQLFSICLRINGIRMVGSQPRKIR
ncbi:hypothetical protein D3C87_1997230 [compost metagenome]